MNPSEIPPEGAEAARDPILPPREEADALIPPPGGVVCRIAGDARLFAASSYAVILQVAHPTVGAGVSEHSNFRADPWGRLLRTLDYTTCTIYGGPDLAWDVGRRVREMHKHIKGVRSDGVRYHALEPKAYAWVHATLAEAIVEGHQTFASPRLTDAEVERFWEEWLPAGRLVGVREGDLPETWTEFRDYFDTMVHDELEHTDSVRDVIETAGQAHAPADAMAPRGRLEGRAHAGLARGPRRPGGNARPRAARALRDRVDPREGPRVPRRRRDLPPVGKADAEAGEELRPELPALAPRCDRPRRGRLGQGRQARDPRHGCRLDGTGDRAASSAPSIRASRPPPTPHPSASSTPRSSSAPNRASAT